MSFRREIGSFLYENKSESVNSSVVSDSFETPWIPACQASLSFITSQSLLKVVFIVSMMPFNHLILYCPPSPLALSLSQDQDLFGY